MTQRAFMRKLYAELGANEAPVIQAYAAAERRGEVARDRNEHALSEKQYAAALLSDGLRKGWIQER
jgi:hypothetical protein